jgi:antitoxin component of RelBE/YafQ-DinJ toxin-antitoxin module
MARKKASAGDQGTEQIVRADVDPRFKVPNAETRKVIDDARRGKNVKSFNTLEELFNDLNS